MTQPGPVPGRIPLVESKNIATSHRMKSAIPRSFARLSQTSLVLVLTLFTVWTAVVVSVSLERLIPSGLPVHVLRAGVTTPRSSGIQPLLVRVVRDGHGSKLYIGSELVAWADLGALLKKDLALRPPDWPVYVEGDPDLEWRQVAEAIDAVRGQQAEVVLLTGAAKCQ